jgi:hypothetical protein
MYVRRDHQQWLCSHPVAEPASSPDASRHWPRNSTFCGVEPTVTDSFNDSFVVKFIWDGTRDRSPFAAINDALSFREKQTGGEPAIIEYNHKLAKWAAHYLSSRWKTPTFVADCFFTSMADVVLPTANGTAARMTVGALLERHSIMTSNAGSIKMAGCPGTGDECLFLRLSAQIYLEQEDFVQLGELVLQLLAEFDPAFESGQNYRQVSPGGVPADED